MEEVRKKEAKGERKDRREGGWWRGEKVRMRNNNGWKAFHWSMKWELGDSFTHSCTKSPTPSPPKKAPPLLSDLVAPPCVCGGVRAALVDTKQTKTLETGDSLTCRSLCCCSAFLQFPLNSFATWFSPQTLFIYTHARPSVFTNIVPSERIKLSDMKWAFDIRSELCSKKTGKVILLQRKTKKTSNHQRAAVNSPVSYTFTVSAVYQPKSTTRRLVCSSVEATLWTVLSAMQGCWIALNQG